MNIISLLLYTISINLDNIPIGISLELNSKKSTLKKLLRISFFTSLITLISMIIGKYISFMFPVKIANRLGATILIIIGSYLLFKEYNLKSKNKCKNPANFHEILVLSINNSLAGLSASITGINYFFATIFNFVFSSIFLYLGSKIGKKVNNTKIEKYSNYLSAIIIIILGIIEWR